MREELKKFRNGCGQLDVRCFSRKRIPEREGRVRRALREELKKFRSWVRSGSRLYYISRLALLAYLSAVGTLEGLRRQVPHFTGFIRKYWGRYHLQRTTRGGYIYHKLLTQRTPHWNLFDD